MVGSSNHKRKNNGMKILLVFIFCFILWAFPVFAIGVIVYFLGAKGIGIVIMILSLFLKSEKLEEIQKKSAK